MDFISTFVIGAAALFGFQEMLSIVNAWWEGGSAFDAAATAIGAEFPQAATLVASTTEAIEAAASEAENW
jgi:hypothetical protein